MNSKTMKKEQKINGKSVVMLFVKLAILIICAVIWRLLIPLFGATQVSSFISYGLILVLMTIAFEIILTPLKRKVNALSNDRTYCAFYHATRTIIGSIAYIVYFAAADAMVTQLFGWALKSSEYNGFELQLPKIVSLLMSMVGMSWFMRNSFRVYNGGVAKTDAIKKLVPIIEVIALSALAIILSALPSASMTVAMIIVLCLDGILLALYTIIPAYKKQFKVSVLGVIIRYYLYYALFAGGAVIALFASRNYGNQWKEMVINGAIGLVIALVICVIVVIADKNFRNVSVSKSNAL